MGLRGARLLRPEYRAAFEQDLRELHERSGPWHLVLISGDLTATGGPREFDLLDSSLNFLWTVFRNLGSSPLLLAVPGSHDRWQGPTHLERAGSLLLSEALPAVRKESSLGRLIHEAFSPFTRWLTSWHQIQSASGIERLGIGLLPGDFAATVRVEEFSVGVVGLNSFFRATSSTTQEIHVDQLEAVTGEDVKSWGLRHDFLLLLTHASPVMLNPSRLDAVREKLTLADRPLLHLCGSRNKGGWIPTPVSFSWPQAIQAPSLFGEFPSDAGGWGYYAGQMEMTGAARRLHLFPRVADVEPFLGDISFWPDRKGPKSEESISIFLDIFLDAVPKKPPLQNPVAQASPSQDKPPLMPDMVRSRLADKVKLEVLEPTPVPASLPPSVRPAKVLSTSLNKVSKLVWSPDGETLGVGLSRGPVAQWKPGEQPHRRMIAAHSSGLEDFCFSPDGQSLASRSEHNVRLWKSDGTRIPTQYLMQGHGTVLAWSASGLLAYEAEGSLQIWELQTGTRKTTLSLPSGPAPVHCLAWSPDGQFLACGSEGDVGFIYWKVRVGYLSLVNPALAGMGFRGTILSLAWMPTAPRIALADRDGPIHIFDIDKGESITQLEGHTAAVTGVSFSSDGRLLASRSRDGTIRLWRTDTWEQAASLQEHVSPLSRAGLAFSPTKPVLATLGADDCDVRLWDIDVEALLRAQPRTTTIHESSAKVVLVGEGRVGKSCLALRLVQGRYEEMDSTHGMRFWTMPVEDSAPDSSSGIRPRREIILWDMGGQSEYQLVHQLFLKDSAAALMVMEPGRGERALEGMEGWDQRLLAQAGGRNIRKLLVGTKLDSAEAPENRLAIDSLVQRRQFASYVPTSAKTGKGIPELKSALVKTIDWGSIETVSRPELFQRLRQHIQRLRESKRVVLTFSELEEELSHQLGSDFDPEALQVVVGQLTRQGLVMDSRMADGTRVLILEVEQVERYAGSIILAARDNPHGVPAIDVAKVLSPAMQFPRLPPQERLRRDQELPVLDCVIELLLEHGLCLHHEGQLVFPSLFQVTQSETGGDFAHAVSLHYDFSGPIDNIYASLVTSLAVSRHFGPVRLWENRAEFGRAEEYASGVRRVKQGSQGARGYARLDVYFDAGAPNARRDLFVNFIEEHLREQGVELLERLSITCRCGTVFPEDVIRERLQEGHTDIGCSRCDFRTPLTLGAQQSRGRNPELVQQLRALRTNIEALRSESIIVALNPKGDPKNVSPPRETPLRILHLSDLHVGAGDDPLSLLQPLVAALQDPQELGVERLDYLVISGDITNRAAPQEFEKAHAFVSELIQRFELTAARCILVPGNHDLDWNTEVYKWEKKRQVDARRLEPGTFLEENTGYLLRDEARYRERFKNFSQHFYHPLTQRPYPLAPEEQCLPFFFRESRLQFLTMNSAWEIDEYFRERSSISEQALSRGLDAANQELAEARKRGDLEEGAQVLRIAVWHHPITGNEKIQADAFMGRLLQANVRVCLHGHVHEDRADLVNYLDPMRRLHVVGAGSFGAPTHDRPESVPRLFNLMEIQRDLKRMRVHTRCLRKHGGAWEGWAVWPGERLGEKRTYYEVTLP